PAAPSHFSVASGSRPQTDSARALTTRLLSLCGAYAATQREPSANPGGLRGAGIGAGRERAVIGTSPACARRGDNSVGGSVGRALHFEFLHGRRSSLCF